MPPPEADDEGLRHPAGLVHDAVAAEAVSNARTKSRNDVVRPNVLVKEGLILRYRHFFAVPISWNCLKAGP